MSSARDFAAFEKHDLYCHKARWCGFGSTSECVCVSIRQRHVTESEIPKGRGWHDGK